jgi:ribosomal protein S18 acetylase RimI-like enzyme
MIRPFSFPDLDSVLQIEGQSFPKSPYDWTTFLNLHAFYPETFLVCINPPTPRPEASGSPSTRAFDLSSSRRAQAEGLGVDPERRLPTRPEGRGLDAIERVNTNHDRKEEEILGYIIFTMEGHVISIAVHPQHRRKGIGTQLLQKAMKNPHLKKIWAEVRRSNQGAQAFYFNMGFQITGMVPNYYGNEDALIIQWIPATIKQQD